MEIFQTIPDESHIFWWRIFAFLFSRNKPYLKIEYVIEIMMGADVSLIAITYVLIHMMEPTPVALKFKGIVVE